MNVKYTEVIAMLLKENMHEKILKDIKVNKYQCISKSRSASSTVKISFHLFPESTVRLFSFFLIVYHECFKRLDLIALKY